jgi:hypothetical protein
MVDQEGIYSGRDLLGMRAGVVVVGVEVGGGS